MAAVAGKNRICLVISSLGGENVKVEEELSVHHGYNVLGRRSVDEQMEKEATEGVGEAKT